MCTGNGAIAIIAAGHSRDRQREFAVTGVDMARIDPVEAIGETYPAAHDVRFLASVDATSLPFAAGFFDCVTSQFGIEYADIDAALIEIARTLAPSGRFLALTHAAGGVVHTAAQEELHRIEDADLPELFSLAETFRTASSNPDRTGLKGAADALNAKIKILAEEPAHSGSPRTIAKLVHDALSALPTHGANATAQALRSVVLSAEAHIERSRALVNAALTDAAAHDVLDRLGSLGFSNRRFERLHHSERGHIGWFFNASLSDDS